MTRQIRVLGHFHLYPPGHNAGAEWMAHSILTRLKREHGFAVEVITNRPPRRRNTFQGIPVEMVREPRRQSLAHRRADVVITHLDATAQAIFQTRRSGRPLVHLVHNDAQLAHNRVTPDKAQLVVWNSQWIADAHPDWAGPSMVVYPPVWCADYELGPGEPGSAIMLLNTSYAKGGELFWELAARMPDVPFVGVLGSYGLPVDPPDLPNVTVLPNGPDVRKAYRLARILVMPSSYESWGRVAVEGGAAGIPTIASCTPGLIECGVPIAHVPVEAQAEGRTVGGFARLRTTTETADLWEVEIRRLLDPDAWEHASKLARERALHLEAVTLEQVDTLANKLRDLAR